jgi:SulP family sulfate permease
MAFAIASGVPAQTGLYRAIVASFAISTPGKSSTRIGGSTGAFVEVFFFSGPQTWHQRRKRDSITD